jgi:hypothetical protein
MTKRRSRRGSGGTWWVVVVLVVVALALWWFSTRRAEAPSPPTTVPGARVLGAAPARGGSEITAPEREELQRVLRERSGAGEREE